MNNVGFNYGMMGLQNMDRLGDLENKKIWAEYENRMKESEAKNEAIGSLIGNVAGAGLAGYKEYKKGEFDADVTNAEAARNQFPDEKSYQESLKNNYSPEVQKEVAWRRTLPKEGRDYYGLEDAAPEWSKKTGVTANRDAQGQALPASTWPLSQDRPIVFAKSPTRARLTSTWNDTSDGFKSAFNSLLSGFPSNIIG